MTICERRALQVKWEAGEPGVRYRMPVALARERVWRACRRKNLWWLDHPHDLAKLLSDAVNSMVDVINDGLAEIADGLTELAAWMHGSVS